MLMTIPLLTAILFATLYPLCFWIHFKDPLKNNFHRFHLGFALFVAGVATVGLGILNLSSLITIVSILWLSAFLAITAFYWKKEYPNAAIVSLICILGGIVFVLVENHFMGSTGRIFFSEILGGLILASTTYAMNLGHGYLNVHGLPIHHLRRATYVMGAFLILRLVWDLVSFLTTTVIYQGDLIGLFEFVMTLDGFLILVAILFGTILPLIGTYFVLGTLKVKSTQSATGILYVLLSAVLLGDLTYRYYLLKFGIAL
ncbi:MAG: hypothetical protein NUV91_01540 [Candidatus Omnitrophica bacterium]|nr:hypothetical protein [Candidatus Omnitrophota bacterium]